MSQLGGALGGFLAGHIISPVTGALLQPASNLLSQAVNNVAPTAIPDITSLLRLYYSRSIRPGLMQTLIRGHGVDWRGPPAGFDGFARHGAGEAWEALATVGTPQPSIDLVRYYWLLSGRPDGEGGWTTGRLRDLLRRQGITSATDQAMFIEHSQLPGVAEVLSARNQGLISDTAADERLRQLGWLGTWPRELMLGLSKPVDWGSAVQYWLRHPELGLDWLTARLRWLGVLDAQSQDILEELVVSLPPAADIGRWVSTGVADPQWVQRFGLGLSPDGDYVRALRRAGVLGGGPSPAVSTDGQPLTMDQYRHWIDHWRKLDPATADLLWAKLRPELIPAIQGIADTDGSFPLANVAPFSLADRIKAYQYSGYTETQARMLVAAQFPAISIRIARMGVHMGLIDRPAVKALFQREGYTDADAELLTQVEWSAAGQDFRLAVATEANRAKQELVTLTVKAGANGYMPPAQASQQLQAVGATADQAAQALTAEYAASELGWRLKVHEEQRGQYLKELLALYEMGAMDDGSLAAALGGLGFPAPTLALLRANIQLAVRRRIVAEAVRAIESNYRDGAIDRGTAASQLAAAGIVPAQIDLYLREWHAKQTDRSKRLSTGEVLKYYKDGLLSRAAVLQRLEQLGWKQTDAMLQIADVEVQASRAQQKAQQSAQRKVLLDLRDQQKYHQQLAAWSAKEQAQAVKDLEDSLKVAISVAKAQASVSDLEKWLKAGLIDDGTYVQAMRQRGFTDPVINIRYASKLGTGTVADVASQYPGIPPGPEGALIPDGSVSVLSAEAATGKAQGPQAPVARPLEPIPH